MTIGDWISLTEWFGGVLCGLVCLICAFVWWVRREGFEGREKLAADLHEAEARFASKQGVQDLDIARLREDHDKVLAAQAKEFNDFRIDISGKLFTRQDADVLRRDMTAMIEPVKQQVSQVQSSLDRELGSLKGKVDALCMGLLKDK